MPIGTARGFAIEYIEHHSSEQNRARGCRNAASSSPIFSLALSRKADFTDDGARNVPRENDALFASA